MSTESLAGIFHPLLLIPASAALLNAALAWFGWRKRPAEGAGAFALLMLATAIWSAFNTLELSATDLPTKIFWLKLEYLGILLQPAAWLAFALQYSGRGQWLTRRLVLLLAVEPTAMLFLLWTNDAHRLFFRHWGIRQGSLFLEWENINGPLYWINIAYAYGLIALGSFLLLQHLSRLPAPHGRRELVVIVGVLLPLFGNVLYNLYDFPVRGLDPTPFALSLSGLMFAWGLFSLGLFEVRPAPSVERDDLPAWRLHILEGILRGVFIVWMFALASGIANVIETYHTERAVAPHPLRTALTVIAFYLGVTLLFASITFLRRLPYAVRAGAFLFILYALGMVGLLLASLSGDGRVFLFAFIVLAAIFFGLRFSLFAAALSLITLVVMGWLQVSGRIIVPAERQINSTDASAWTSGTLVFLILSIAALISITYLLRTLENSLHRLRAALAREQRLSRMVRTVSEINQLIVRERDPQQLLEQTCQRLLAGRDYDFIWIGLLEEDGLTIKAVASAGEPADLERFASRLDPEPGAPTCAAAALRARHPIYVPQDDPCLACPILARHPQRVSLALPMIYEDRPLGILVVDHSSVAALDDLAHALATLRAAEQQRKLAERSGRLLFAREEETLWTEVITAVQNILHADRVAIYRYDRQSDTLSCLRSYGLSQEYVDEINRCFHQAPGSAILRDPRPVVIQDVETDPATAALREWMRREGFRSYAVFPFYTSKGMVGAFTAYRNAPGAFTSSDLAAGEALVHMIGLALENLELNAETRRKASELGALYAAAQDMASSLLDSDSLLLALARHVTEALQATSAYINSVDLERGTLRVVAEYWSVHAILPERKSDLGRVYSLADYPVFHRTLLSGKAAVLHYDDPQASEAERRQFEEYGVRSILFVPVMAHGKNLGGLEIWESRRRREFTMAEILLVQAMASHAAAVLESAQLFQQLSEAYDRTLEGWARALEMRDELTEGHTRRVTELTLRLGRAMGLSEEQIVHIRRGAILHDIGKMAIPDSILLKEDHLTPEEMMIMRRHPQFAYDMLYPIEFLRPALDIPYCHHEKWDGSGYPRGLKGKEIPLAARIFAVADVWDAITTDRPYRPGWPKPKALDYLRSQAGKHFDPEVVHVFLSLIEQEQQREENS